MCHNEEILDQAYRTSKDVFLIFSINKSGFYEYVRLALILVVLLRLLNCFIGWQDQSYGMELACLGSLPLSLPLPLPRCRC